jgi:four helix bundle protein
LKGRFNPVEKSKGQVQSQFFNAISCILVCSTLNPLYMEKVSSFRDLDVYKLSRQLSKEVFELSKTFPKDEMYSLIDQIRRSSRSIGGQIAEAWAKRRYERHFISKLTDASGEHLETEHWIETSFDCDYISKELSNNLLERYDVLGKMLNSMIKKARWFCD